MNIPNPESEGKPDYIQDRTDIRVVEGGKQELNDTTWRAYREDPESVYVMYTSDIDEATDQSPSEYAFYLEGLRTGLSREFADELGIISPTLDGHDVAIVIGAADSPTSTRWLVPRFWLEEFLDRIDRELPSP